MGSIGIWQLVIILVIVVLLFGTKRLKNIGSDLGGAVKGFKKAVKDEEAATEEKIQHQDSDSAAQQKTAEKDKEQS